MLELLLALMIILLAVGGLAAGLLLGRRSITTSCEGMACMERDNCAGCPNRQHAAKGAEE
jgi:hypothetical protein